MRQYSIEVTLVKKSGEEEFVPQSEQLMGFQLLQPVLDHLRSLAVLGPFDLRESVSEVLSTACLELVSLLQWVQDGLANVPGLLNRHIAMKISAIFDVVQAAVMEGVEFECSLDASVIYSCALLITRLLRIIIQLPCL